MSNLITTPEMLATAATDIDGIRSAITTASSTAAGPTTGVLAAAEDEVSTAIAELFGSYGQEYQGLVAQAAAFHTEFTQALAGAGNVYAEAESANAALTSATSNAVNGPIQALVGATPAQTPAPAQQIALIMGGTGNPLPDLDYVIAIDKSYIQQLFPGANSQGLFTPEQFWPVTPALGNLTFDQSVGQGVTLLDAAIKSHIVGNNVNVFGYSQSATVATHEIQALMAAGSPYSNSLSFTLVGDPNNPNGGILTRFPGFYLPFLDVAFGGATPPDSPYHTVIFTAQYDGIADAPQYPLNVLSDVNAVMGYFYVHNTYPLLTPDQVAHAVPLPTSPGYTGKTQYYMLMTQHLPLVEPIRDIPYAGPPIADLFQPDLRVLVDMGYSDYGPNGGYANITTPSALFALPNPFVIIPDLVIGIPQGIQAAIVDIPVEAGALPTDTSYYPQTYPYVPSINPGLHFYTGQPQSTLLGSITGGLGNILDLIPAPVFPEPPPTTT
ncbi:MAG: PE-PPE domain-containing protein [Mycobacterium sp.]|uniref:PE family protein n=1 Tax=Mycobacterium sp. TaxID=1785 RepID=UPI001EB19541|nr:PE-PPE domain-containing protein [Mycobacterium sp.]MBW0019585.1 PE-PPE domain-containing protein [Mycobacterium sp.]